MTFIKNFISFLIEYKNELAEQVAEHLWLTLVSLSLALVIGVFLGIIIDRKKQFSSFVLGIVNVFQTIPSVALLGFLLPFLGIGVMPAIVALFLYGLLPIVRNTYTGLSGVDHSVIEAAKGMGLSANQILTKVKLPLALPVIFAGIRTAFVVNVGVATLCALIAAGGLGESIFRGLSTNNTYMILAGAIPAALLALLFDFLMGLVEKHINRILKPVLIAAVLIVLSLAGMQFFQEDSQKLRAGFPSEFITRGDGYVGLKKKYNLDLKIHEMEIGLMYNALQDDFVDVISGFSTDGKIQGFDLKILEDDKSYFPPYHAAPIISGKTMKRHPEIGEALQLVAGKISDAEMTAMNHKVDEKHINTHKVALEFLESIQLKTSVTRESPADIVIGSKNFTENYILAEIFKILIENYTSLSVDLKLGFGGTKLCFDALRTDEIDLYPEYTGTGLLVILKPDEDILSKVDYDKNSVFNYVSAEFERNYDIHWLKPLGFNNTFALMMKRNQAKRLGVEKISDLSP